MSIRRRLTYSFATVALAGFLAGEAFADLGSVLLWVALAAALAAVVVSMASLKVVADSTAALRDAAQRVASGDAEVRVPLTLPGELETAGTALRVIQDRIDRAAQTLDEEQTLLRAVTMSTSEGLFVVDRRQRIVWLNEAARRFLQVRGATPLSTGDIPRISGLHQLIQHALSGGPTVPIEFEVAGTVLAASSQSLHDGSVVVALFDVTHLRGLESMRRDFVANVSHELKTPLTTILGFSETLATEDLSPALAKDFAERIASNATRMQRLVEGLLDLARIESGAWTPRHAVVHANSAMRDVADSYAHRAAIRGVRIELSIEGPDDALSADPVAVNQVLANLVENAIRHTAEGGEVRVFFERESRGVWLRVRDTGVGIAAEHVPRIFERFYRVDHDRGRDTGGTGLGLAIVKHLAEAHGGRVTAESTVGQGTTISAYFPGP
jgi:two-component system phosphate regulon sensor histidine kinase PhoR